MAFSSSPEEYIKLISKSGYKVVTDRSALMESSPVMKTALESTIIVRALFLQEADNNIQLLKEFLNMDKNPYFRRFLGYADFTEVCGLYKIAKIYHIKKMLIYCRRSMIPKINVNNVCAIHDFSCQQVDRYIQYCCWRKFDEKWEEIINSENFILSEITTVNTFVCRPKYTSLNEFALFKAVHLWALRRYFLDNGEASKYSDNFTNQMRCYMNSFFNKIRFLTMNAEDIKIAYSYNLLYEEEEKVISSYINQKILINLPNTICEKTVKRTEVCYRSLIEYKHHPNLIVPNSRNVTSDSKFCCRFTPEEDCFLVDVILPIKTDESVSVKIKIETENILIYEAIHYCSDLGLLYPSGINSTERIFVFLSKNNEYFLNGYVDMEPVKKIDFEIKIREYSQFYIEESEFQHMQKSKEEEALSDWNKYLAKVRLYF